MEALRDAFLAWLDRHRSPKTRRERALHLRRFVEFLPGRTAESVDGKDVERFVAWMRSRGWADDYCKKHTTSVRAMYRQGVFQGWIRPTNPFARVEPIRLPAKVLRESDLPTPDEVARLFAAAKGVMHDLLTLFLHTGARTHELLDMRVGDYQPLNRIVVLGRHKRSRTMKDPTPRTILLNDRADEVLARLTRGRTADEHVVLNGRGKPYCSSAVDGRFANLRWLAGVRGHVTPYSFRHLLATDYLQAGVDSALVAKTLGTSTAMLERVYCHWRTGAMRDAQLRVDAMRAARRD